MPTTRDTEARHDIIVEDVEYQRKAAARCSPGSTGRAARARFRRCCRCMAAPGSTRTAPTTISSPRRLAESGILVASIDFRMPPEAPYPASLADINLGSRWLKAPRRAI